MRIHGRSAGGRAAWLALAMLATRSFSLAQDAAQPPAPAAAPTKPEVPADFRGAALPLESELLDGRIRRAEEHFAAQEWARGIAVLDEVLGEVTAPPGKKKAPAVKKAPAPAGPPGRARVFRRGRQVVSPDDAGEETVSEVPAAEVVASTDGIRFVPVASFLRQRLLELPEEARAIYRRTYEAPARQALEKALQLPADKARVELRRLADRYPLAPPGANAWKFLAERQLESSHPGEAARAFEVRLELPFAVGEENAARATLLAQQASSLALAGRAPGAVRSLDEIARNYPETLVAVRGEPVPGRSLREHELFRTLLEKASPASRGPLCWSTGAGTFDHAAFGLPPETLPALGSQARWIHRLEPEPSESNGVVYGLPFGPERGAAIGTTIYLRKDQDLVALDAATGARRWTARPSTLGESRGSPQDGFQPSYSQGPVDAGAAVTVVRTGPNADDALVACVHQGVRVGETESGQVVYAPSLIAAFHARTGKVLWTFGQSHNERDPTRGLAFTAVPAFESGLLIAPASRGENLYVVAITLSGKLAWLRRLYTYNPANQGQSSAGAVHGLQLAASEGIVVAAHGHGLVVALDAPSGEILWVSRYRSGTRNRYNPYALQPSPPVVSGSVVLAAPPDSDHLTAFDLRTGRALWDRKLPTSGNRKLLGATRDLAIVGGSKVHALSLVDGKDAWASETLSRAGERSGDLPEDAADAYAPASEVTSAVIVAEPAGGKAAVLAVAGDGSLVQLDAANGKTQSALRFFDPRLARGQPFGIFLAEGQIVAVTPSSIFALEPQSASWSSAGDLKTRNLMPRARLLRAEGRFDEALETLATLETTLQSKQLVERMQKDIVLTARAAATATGKARYITELLARPQPLVKERGEILALRLLEAKLLERNGSGSPADQAPAIAAYVALSSLDGILAPTGDGMEVDVGAYASDSLRELKAKGATILDPRGEERARKISARGPDGLDARQASFAVLRRPHLGGSDALEARLSKEAEADGDLPAAVGLEELLRDDSPSVKSDAASTARLEKLSASLPAETPLAGLSELLDSRLPPGVKTGIKLAQLFWLPGEEGFLASQDASSTPLPVIASLFGTKLRFHDRTGKLVLERPLTDYPDITEVKLTLQAHIEEPAIVRRRDDELLLFTAAGLYSFRGLTSPAGPAGLRARDVKLAWARTWQHPLTELGGGRHWGGISITQEKNFFAELAFDGANPLLLLRDGTLESIEPRTGKLAWRIPGQYGTPSSPPLLRAPWILTRTASPAGLSVERLPRAARGKGSKTASSRFLAAVDNSMGIQNAALAAGGLAAVFESQSPHRSQSIDVMETASGRLLWRLLDGSAQIAFSSGSDVWLSERGGKLVARSVRSGRERRRVAVPEGAVVVETFFEKGAASGGPKGWTLVMSRSHVRTTYYGYNDRGQTGEDLYLVRLDAQGGKLWETRVHKGPIAYDGGRFSSRDGRFVLLFNAEEGEEKWYTHAVMVDPLTGAADDFLSVEIHGKGTGQTPRLQMLEGGLGIGNTDGFGWFAAPAPAQGDGKEPER